MIALVWFKRDIRWDDHLPLKSAIESGLPVLLLYCVEPILLNSLEYSDRHWWFQYGSIREMNSHLQPFGATINSVQGEITDVFSNISAQIGPFQLFSHEETGQYCTYERDLKVANWCRENGVKWTEFQQFGVKRGRKNRDDWSVEWDRFMNSPQEKINLDKGVYLRLSPEIREKFKIHHLLNVSPENFQKPGRNAGLEALNSFVNERSKNYSKHISKPLESRSSCSRLSPHIAWGTVSLREIVQAIDRAQKNGNKRNLANFKSRLYWHCHFIQKLESETTTEFRNQNAAFNSIRTELNDHFFEQWKNGMTGFPLVDACMRCVVQTGYINFRMRAMVVSFWTHHLFQPWKPAATFLAAQFLDYEPGIHFSQFQMQAGTVGYHTVRTYNPVKQAQDHDLDAVFIQTWIPELKSLPSHFAREPWTMTAMEELFYDFKTGIDYPNRLVDMEVTGKYARDTIHAIKNSSLARMAANEIRKKHVNTK